MNLLKQTLGAIGYTIWVSCSIITLTIIFVFQMFFDILTLGIFNRSEPSDWE